MTEPAASPRAPLPDGWAWARLEDLAAPGRRAITDGPFGSNLKTEHYTTEGPLVIRLQNIGDGLFRDERAHIDQARYELLRDHAVEPGDVLIAALGEQLPRACVAPSWLPPAIVKADCFRLRPHPEINARYLASALNSPPMRTFVSGLISGVGRPRINLAKARALMIPVPPSAEQNRIVAAIEELFSYLENAETSLRLVRSKLHQLRAAVFASATQFENDVPLVPLAELCSPGRKPAYGVLQPGSHVPEGTPLLRIGDINSLVVGTVSKRIDPVIAARYPRTKLAGGEVLLTLVGTIGRAAVAAPELAGANVARAVGVLPINEKTDSRYVALALSHPSATWRLNNLAHEVARKTLNLEDVRRFEIPVPPIDEQISIVAEADRKLSIIDSLSVTLEHAFIRAKYLAQAILRHAFNGRLVPRDPSDEPASALLEQIAVARGTSTTSKSPARRSTP